MISVIIPTYNRAQMVADCVASVLATNEPDLEVIVVDDCSPDDTREMLARRFGSDTRVRYARNSNNSFQAVSRNYGAKLAKGDYLFFLDDDNLVHHEIFIELKAAFEQRPNAGLIAPLAVHRRIGGVNVVWTLGSDFNRWTSQPKDTHPNLPLACLEKTLATMPSPSPTANEVTAPLLQTTYSPNAFMVPRAAFEAVGGFDERYVQMFEESDFGWRLRKAGFETYIAPNARTDHLGFLEPGCTPALRLLGIEKPYRTFCLARNRLRFARKHFNFLQILSVTLIFAPLSAVYYCATALRHRRPDIAWAYLKGTLVGIFGFQRRLARVVPIERKRTIRPLKCADQIKINCDLCEDSANLWETA